MSLKSALAMCRARKKLSRTNRTASAACALTAPARRSTLCEFIPIVSDELRKAKETGDGVVRLWF
jgi:hypothetical protein